MEKKSEPPVPHALFAGAKDAVAHHLKRAKHGEPLAIWEEIKQILIENQLGRPNVSMPADRVGCNSKNRSKIGLTAAAVHKHGEEIMRLGFSLSKCADATAVEKPPPPPFDNHELEFNDKIIAMSNGMLPPLGEMQLLSLAGGHTNAFLRCLKAGSPTTCKDLQDETGRLSAGKLSAGKPQLQRALADGMRFNAMRCV